MKEIKVFDNPALRGMKRLGYMEADGWGTGGSAVGRAVTCTRAVEEIHGNDY
jgi:hypothetical protein